MRSSKTLVSAVLVSIAVLLSAAYVGLALAGFMPLTAPAPAVPSPFSTAGLATNLERAKAVQKAYPLIDGHNDLPWQYRKYSNNSVLAPHVDISKDISYGEFYTNIPLLRAGMVGGQFWSVYMDCGRQGEDAVRATLEQVDVVYNFVRNFPETFQIATTADEVEAAFKNGRIASLLGMEGAHSIDGSLGALRMFFQLGVRYMTLTHTCNNPLADSAGNECHNAIDCRAGACVDGECSVPQSVGVTAFGERAIGEMNRLGMLVDLSHVTANAMRRALSVTRAPAIFSHSSAYTLAKTTRNVPDDVLLALKSNGGVIMISFVPSFTVIDGNATLAKVADHIDYVARGKCPAWAPACKSGSFSGIGASHVGLGSDFDGILTRPAGLEDPSRFLYLTAELFARGYTDAEVRGIIGGNVLRVLREAEKVARSMEGTFPDETMIFPSRPPCRANTVP